MVHEEIIIIRICELDKNVRAEIEKRRIEDEELARLTGPIAENDEQDSTNTTKVNLLSASGESLSKNMFPYF